MNAKDFDIALKDVEGRLEHLRIRFEQYFQGLERMAPERDHEALRRSLLELQRHVPRNTALRFRYQQLKQKRVTLSTYWTRVCRQIEEGTYRRDVLRARKRHADVESRASAPASFDIDVDLDMDMDAEVDAALDALSGPPTERPAPPSVTPFAGLAAAPRKASDAPTIAKFGPPASHPPRRPTAPKAPPPPPARCAPAAPARPAPPRPASAGGLGDDSVRRIYDRYLEARRKNNERVDNVKLATLKRSIDKMMPKLRQKHAGKRIDFEVVVKNGRVGLKPVAKDA
ncbi:MAG: hypothetical protein GXP55_15280 [Deltaproteobacteria bacterium]|nr:hypothetical protein [Deltaproteobacteria bacterium]